ncbi:hypothetical protein C0J52_13205 [Blattella germanica]|nr:hypothetical protein C0J52_13205 [Blattella germanica]
MRRSTLDSKPSEILTSALTAEQKIYIYFIGATVFQSAIYMFDFASCIAVVNEHYKNGYPVWGTISLLLMYLPSGVFYVVIISRPDLWDEKDGALGMAQWCAYRTIQFLAYPIWVMYRYAKQFFWAVEALFQKDEFEREEALHNANQPSQTELYLFLQAFLQAIPQAFLQIYIMLAHYKEDKTISQMQALCITSSLMLISSTTVNFLWFESQKLTGRKEPWSPREPFLMKIISTIQDQQPIKEKSVKIEEEAESSTPFLEPRGLPPNTSDNDLNYSITDEGKNAANESGNIEPFISIPSQVAPPRPRSNSDTRSVVDLREDKPISQDIMDLENKINSEERSVSENMTIENPTVKPERDSANVDLPTRKIRLMGREYDDALGKTIAFLWWWLFLFSRFLALGSCANFQPYVLLGAIIIHYIINMIHLLIRSGFPSIYKVFVQLCLGYVFLFCFIEFRYKLTRVNVFYLCFFLYMVLENTVLSLSWYAYSDLDGFWYEFVFILIFASCTLSLLCMVLYFTILKPKRNILLE